ncbi:AI-2E family transporter [Chroococcidiopsis cubana SAG 39.79]|uniref:AI-2E family transporter n=1 Tax=Chroococcidiopsis cubana SAG 39.79 TaxID=388085 RepID=A0AB37UGM7_9CYAN|nr:AI-2E family transporter [Chroococcidiopsis cubana]RUT10426.1 AI-2E family transporter [Chroococcidiopsis cubana SAG 39.79]
MWSQTNNSALVRFLLLFASGWALLQLLSYFKTVIFIFAFAAILAFLLSYPVRWLSRFLPRILAVISVFLLSFTSITGLIVIVSLSVFSQAQQLIQSIILFLNSLLPSVERLERFMQRWDMQIDLNVIQQQLQEEIASFYTRSLTYLFIHSQVFFTNFLTLILMAAVTFFMLLYGQRLWLFVLSLLPVSSHSRFSNLVERKFLAFIKGQFLLVLFLSFTTFMVFLVLEIPFPLILSLAIGLTNLIPGIGAILGISIVSLAVLSQSVWLALKVLGVCFVLQQIQNNLIAPKVMQDSVNLNPVIVLFAILVGARVAGILGVFLAIPITGILASFFEIEEMQAEL